MGIVKKDVVIGIDSCNAGLEDGDQFIIPSTKGELRYLKTARSRPMWQVLKN